MNKEDLYPLIGKYLNGYKIVKIEDDPFIKGQINLWTDEIRTEYFGDKTIVKFFVRPDSNSSKIYQELVDKEIYKLKDNWNKLKEYLETINKGCPPYEKEVLMFITNKMEELEKSDDNESI